MARNSDLDDESWNLDNAEVSNGDGLALHFPCFGVYLVDEGRIRVVPLLWDVGDGEWIYDVTRHPLLDASPRGPYFEERSGSSFDGCRHGTLLMSRVRPAHIVPFGIPHDELKPIRIRSITNKQQIASSFCIFSNSKTINLLEKMDRTYHQLECCEFVGHFP